MISAKIVADSVSPSGIRLTTMELNYPRFIHAEAKTHRVFSLDDEQYELVLKQEVSLMDDIMLSRNASSSRAIPVEKMLQQVRENPAMPIHWGKNQPGMQAREECRATIGLWYWDEIIQERLPYFHSAREAWLEGRDRIVDVAEGFNESGYHKQIVNRLLEPFQFIKVIVTATEWDNFFRLRLHPDAQPEMQELAHQMKKAMVNSSPEELAHGQWHLPYLSNDELAIADPDECLEEAIKWSVARCARVSYLNHDKTFPDREKDIALADKLLEAGHMSPFEHQATPIGDEDCDIELDGVTPMFTNLPEGITHLDRNSVSWSNNFKGWIQHRALLS